MPKEEVTARVWVGSPIHTFGVWHPSRVCRCSGLAVFDPVHKICRVFGGRGLDRRDFKPGNICRCIQPTRGPGSGKPSSKGTSYGKPAKAVPSFSLCISSSTVCSMVPP